MLAVELGEEAGDDLRVLVADQLGDHARLHPLQGLDAGATGAGQDAVDDRLGPALAERTGKSPLHVLDAIDGEAGGVGLAEEVADDHFGAVARDLLEGGHARADRLDLAGIHVFHDLRGVTLAERHQEDRSTVNA